MNIEQLDTETADVDLTSLVTVLTHTPDASNLRECYVGLELGNTATVAKQLDASGGDFDVEITIGSNVYADTVTLGTYARVFQRTALFPVPANEAVVVKVKSPNAADNDVTVTATIYAEPLDTKIDSILADTNELQSNQGNWATATGFAVPGDEMNLADSAITSAKIVSGALTANSITPASTIVAYIGDDTQRTIELATDEDLAELNANSEISKNGGTTWVSLTGTITKQTGRTGHWYAISHDDADVLTSPGQVLYRIANAAETLREFTTRWVDGTDAINTAIEAGQVGVDAAAAKTQATTAATQSTTAATQSTAAAADAAAAKNDAELARQALLNKTTHTDQGGGVTRVTVRNDDDDANVAVVDYDTATGTKTRVS